VTRNFFAPSWTKNRSRYGKTSQISTLQGIAALIRVSHSVIVAVILIFSKYLLALMALAVDRGESSTGGASSAVMAGLVPTIHAEMPQN
jgi:hypothetical protein